MHNRTMLAVLLATGFSLFSFILNWLTIDGTAAAIIFGTISYSLGGLMGAAVVLTFFITASILSKDLIGREGFKEKRFRRDGAQVWSKGFWFSIWLMAWFLTLQDFFVIAAVSSMAMATADTWASEVGGERMKANTRLITTGKKVAPGTDGGVSFHGSLAALCGAMLIALIFGWVYPAAGINSILILVITGFAGCFIDSYLGARFQHKTFNFRKRGIIGDGNLYVSNNFVNWASAGLASFIGMVLTLIFGI
ncbi:MAG: DUF92 domain-containing protein [Balneolaceae bacterium]